MQRSTHAFPNSLVETAWLTASLFSFVSCPLSEQQGNTRDATGRSQPAMIYQNLATLVARLAFISEESRRLAMVAIAVVTALVSRMSFVAEQSRRD